MATGTRATQAMQTTIGADVARETGLQPAQNFPAITVCRTAAGSWRSVFVVTGIFAPTGSIADRLIVTPLESVWHLHPEPATHAIHEPHDHSDAAEDSREITALLVQYASPLAAARLPREINAQSAMQAASQPRK